MRRFLRALGIACGLLPLLTVPACVMGQGAGQAQAPAAPQKKAEKVAMRDGVLLATDIYLPQGDGPFPVVLLRTPYNKDAGAGIGADGARRGYAIVAQDTRGRFASQGANFPFEGDGWWEGRQDGYDTLEWVARQPWCDGKIGTMGGSALGITQLYAAGAGSGRITAQIIHVAMPDFYHHIVFRGGVFRKAMVEDWLRDTKHDPGALEMWKAHPTYDDFWQARSLVPRFGKANAPAVHVGGWYDIFTQGTIDAFLGFQRKGGPKARGKQKLILGPWTHGIFSDKAGELTFANAKNPPGDVDDVWKWFDFHLKGQQNGIGDAPTVTYYVMGDTTDPGAPGNLWRIAEAWPPVKATPTRYYLHADRSLSDTKPGGGGPLTYAYDPKNPVPTVGGPQLTIPSGPRDQRSIESRPDVLVFTSEPLAEPLEVTGRVRAELHIASDAPDTDFVVRLCDVYPDGRSINICEGTLRARFREGFGREKMLTPGKVARIPIDLWSTSIIFNKGHRIRVQVTSSSAPGYDPNPNTGAGFRADSRVQTANNSIYVDSARASHILLPVVKP